MVESNIWIKWADALISASVSKKASNTPALLSRSKRFHTEFQWPKRSGSARQRTFSTVKKCIASRNSRSSVALRPRRGRQARNTSSAFAQSVSVIFVDIADLQISRQPMNQTGFVPGTPKPIPESIRPHGLGGYQGSAPRATEIVEHSLDMNENRLRHDYTRSPIYRCTQSGMDLEGVALGQLESHLSDVHNQFYNAQNFILANRTSELDNVVVTVPVPCQCGSPHNAIFYFRLALNDTSAPGASEMLLANIDGTSLEDELTGIHSKSFLMDALQKLIARWRLKFDQIVIASPFIAHQFMSKEEKLEVWEWLLSILDPQRTLFITRSMATRTTRPRCWIRGSITICSPASA